MVNYNLLKDYVENMSENELLEICIEIYDWKHLTGKVHKKEKLEKISKELSIPVRDIENMVLEVSAKKLAKPILLLLEECPQEFLVLKKNEKSGENK